MKFIRALLLISAFLFFKTDGWTCSMYKITAEGKTMVGCNHDAWLTTPKVWFENANHEKEYGAGFTGAREVGGKKTTPQSGMNTAGLVFSRLTSYYPEQENPFVGRLKITKEADYLSAILHQCGNVQEIRKYIEQYDHSFFMNDVFIYIDSTGNYLIVEPYQLIDGNQANYVLANFCPSRTSTEQARKIERYRKGEDFLNTHTTEPSLAFCKALSDTMHVCRNRNGDGTLLTSIWNTNEQSVNLYFYHNFNNKVYFKLAEELRKGDHSIAIQSLFPKNLEFEQLIKYKTPSNTIGLRFFLVILAALLAIFSLILIISQIWNENSAKISLPILGSIIVANFLLIAYSIVLITNKGIFYFDAPYQHHNSSLITASSYIPILLLLFFLPVLNFSIKRLKSNETKLSIKTVLVLNNITYLIFIIGFAYWGLYTFWN